MPAYTNSGLSIENRQTIEEDVRLAATAITFRNTQLGRVLGQVIFETGGSTLINDSGGYIGAGQHQDPWTFRAVTGSGGADRIVDAGTIAGLVDLGAGNDTLISRAAGSTYATSVYGAAMGSGDDLLRFEGATAPFFVYGDGGSGRDTLEFAATTNQVYGTYLTGFEILSLQASGNYSQFSGYTQIVGAPGMVNGFYNLVDCLNPLAQVQLAGSFWLFQNSTVASLTGGAGSDTVWIGGSSKVGGSISLGGGADTLQLENGVKAASVASAITGGAGLDTLAYLVTASMVDDLARATGFEKLYLTNGAPNKRSVVELANISGFQDIYAESGLSLTLTSGSLAQTSIGGAVGGSIRIASGLSVASYSYAFTGWPVSTDLANPNFRNSTQLHNAGSILGAVTFYDGDDLYDGASGSVAGAVHGNAGNDRLTGGAGAEQLYGDAGADTLRGNGGNDLLYGGTGWDTAILGGSRAAYTVTHLSSGVFEVKGPDGKDIVTDIEFLQFDDGSLRLRPGPGVTVNFSADPAGFMTAIRDYDGNDLGGDDGWLLIGAVDVNGDGNAERILVNDAIGRFATVGTAEDGLVYFADHGQFGETRVVGIYIDPQVQSGDVVAGSEFDSQRRFQNDLQIENINGVLGGDDYDGDGLQEVYLALTDGTAYLHLYMHADGNIQYANYQSEAQVIDYLEANGFDETTYGDWFTPG
ncbi:hypothetical protein [Aurantiacibacter poecillastricola]|uniref:hypothetical protein n=1 Tax=Aurantiacibacter poecillastricola TaxID=3064385 RepID=UPI00273D06EB|nr:hypothetical protein [Aurantiacibacter sp. 219JJ12-13]MDP5261657.1 hypothetical protein [Aurantiacibacter sp. 219JJ12-13]